MAIRSDDYNQVCVIAVDGDLSGENTAGLRKTAEQRIETRHLADFVIDLENCDFIDSEGLETLLWLKRKAEELFGQVRLAGARDNCRKILEITRIEPRFQCHPDLAEALKTIR